MSTDFDEKNTYEKDLSFEVNNDPHAGTSSNFGAYFNVVCVIAGMGVVQMAYAFNQSGWFAAFLTVFSCFLCIYTGHVLVKCLYYDGKSRLSGYSAIGEAAFGKFGKYLVEVFLLCFYFGVGCAFIMLIGINMKDMIDQTSVHLSLKVWTIIAAVVIWVPFVIFKTMKEVEILAVFGTLATVFTVVVILIVGIGHLDESKQYKHEFVHVSGIPIALASISLSFGGSPVFPAVEKTMKTPKSWTKILTCAMVTTLVLYMLAGVIGYLAYGNSVNSPIFQNFPQGAPLTFAATAAITIHVLFAAPILLISFSLDIEKWLRINDECMSQTKQRIVRPVLRTGLMVLFALVSMFVPAFGDFMSLVGALTNCQIIFVFPVVFYLKLYGWRNIRWYELILCAIIIVVGMVSCVLGTIDAVKNLITALSN
ncbi:hypothetical protein K493DRAFT_318560 [Basidiobolus meristosporus CBS 931.73]|uniref:Amino acid transporter transmembrane domain-containing protein n=1 Tax=Basidiobolus meristosporus CBS 931.73 TaxID=1314790 RepID=A0A1Y1XV80_9FUNG|nr:hypothetical protein K493DRAFT_318560 [Basidiobolus meristosporus CBS 931.73]|eukprot:ORX89623.1 hypothetical protein K493DRAFT_318560 [Basidiobolus meristosporus CBS 931.73]